MSRSVKTNRISRHARANIRRGICQHEGCFNKGMECVFAYVPGYPEPEPVYYCGEHAQEEGFCWGCGQFWGGVESFDFSRNGLCDNCRDDPDLTGEWGEDYYTDWEYDPYDG